MTNPPPWYERFFDGPYRRLFGHTLTPERTAREATFIRDALALQPGQELLDLCCGHGRHAVPLAVAGVRVTGQDLHHASLEEASRNAAAAGVPLDTVQADMRDIPFSGRFDAVINIFSAFGYFPTVEEDLTVLTAVQRALRPGGRLLLDTINREWVIAHYVARDWRQDEAGVRYLEERTLDLAQGTIRTEFSVVSPDGAVEALPSFEVRVYALTEMIALLARAGLVFRAAYGDFDGTAYAPESRRMILVAEKPGA